MGTIHLPTLGSNTWGARDTSTSHYWEARQKASTFFWCSLSARLVPTQTSLIFPALVRLLSFLPPISSPNMRIASPHSSLQYRGRFDNSPALQFQELVHVKLAPYIKTLVRNDGREALLNDDMTELFLGYIGACAPDEYRLLPRKYASTFLMTSFSIRYIFFYSVFQSLLIL